MTDLDRRSTIATGPLDTSSGPGWRYLPALDGVRAFAVVAVVLFHYWPAAFPGGFVGVDVFFAMSGFLITSILINEHDRTGSVALGEFWGRRVRRLVPAVVALVIVTAVATVLTGTGSSRQLADSIGALTWTTNLVEAWFGGSRVWLHNSRTTLDHLWSLAIEEQFYLLWPLVALALFRKVGGARARVAVTFGLVVLSALAMGLVGGVHAYFRTDTRAFELLAGAALALGGWGAARVSPAVAGALMTAGAVGVVAIVAFVDPGDAWMYPWGFLVVTACSTAVVAAAAHPTRPMSAVLEQRWIRHLGQVSYGVYLWHIPVLRIMSSKRTGIEGQLLHLARFAVLALVVEASFRWIETPFRTRRMPFRAPQFVLSYVAAGAAVLLLIPATSRDIEAQWDPIDNPPRVASGDERWMIVGDLYGAALASILADDGPAAVWSIADPGCPGLLGSDVAEGASFDDGGRPFDVEDQPYCEHWKERWGRSVNRFQPDVVVLASGYWDTLPIEIDDRRLSGEELEPLYRRLVDAQVETLRRAGVDADRIVVVSVASWDDIFGPSQRGALDDRRDAVAAYAQAVEAVAGELGLRRLEVAAGDDLEDAIRRALR